MKYFLAALTLFFSLNGFSQKMTEIKVAQEKLKEISSVYDLIKDLPGSCVIKENFVFIKNKRFACGGPEFSPEVKSRIQKLIKGQKFFIEELKSTCPDSHKKEYKIIIE